MSPTFLLLPCLTAAFFAQAGANRSYTDPEHGFHRFGSVVTAAGDVNRDGYGDFVVADPGYEPEAVPPRLWILSGADGQTLRTAEFLSFVPRSRFMVVVGGEDANGDCVPDLLVVLGQQVFAVSGQDGSELYRLNLHGPPLVSESLRFVRDRDGDGTVDVAALLVRAEEQEGCIQFFSGRNGAPLSRVAVPNAHQAVAGCFVGLGDQDGDCIEDFAVLLDVGDRSSRLSHGAESRTRVSIELSTRRPARWQRDLTGTYYFSKAVLEAIGDLNRDGVEELAVGCEQEVAVLDGNSGATLFRYEMANKESEAGLGWALARVGDINGDAVPDFVLSHWDPGLYEGMVAAQSGKDGRPIWSVKGNLNPEDIHHLGEQLAAVGDIDGDGITDLVVGTDESIDWWASGAAEVLSGKTGKQLMLIRRRDDEVFVTRGTRAPVSAVR